MGAPGQREDGGGGSRGGRSQMLRTRSDHGASCLKELGEEDADPAQRLGRSQLAGAIEHEASSLQRNCVA